jgi:DNA-binding CsgD family transcriptional regulator
MATLSGRDFEQVERFLRGLYTFRRVGPLVEYVLTELPNLVGSTQTSWNHVVPCLNHAHVTAWPAQANHEVYQAALARHAHEHPLIRRLEQTGDPRAFKISDFVSQREFHDTALYAELYRPLRYEDQFAMNLGPAAPQLVSVVVARDRRTFTERDRRVLNLIRPHLAQAYRNTQSLTRLARLVESRRIEPATSHVMLDRNDRIVHYPARAQRWMEVFFDEPPRSPGRLPERVGQWLTQTRAAEAGQDLGSTVSPLMIERGGRQLVVRHTGVDASSRSTLILEERTSEKAAGWLAELGLTRREVQVLLEVEQGKHNDEIAAALGMRPGTVKKHLEHIFDKLGVDHRTAAVAVLHQQNGRPACGKA